MVKAFAAGRRKAARTTKRCPSAKDNSDGFFSGKFEPSETVRGKAEAKAALKAGTLVLEVEGQFLRVPIRQRLCFKECPRDRTANCARRYDNFRPSRNLREALQAGATPDDLYYDVKKGNLTFLPRLIAKPARGPLPFANWPPGVRKDEAPRPWWLPEDWAHGVKTTCKTHLKAYIAPSARIYYHRPVIEMIVQQQLGGLEGMIEWGLQQIAQGRDWSGRPVKSSCDARLFAALNKKERACLPDAEELHFCVISARRATERTGIRGIVNVQSRLVAAGVQPRWYVDEASVADYRRLGLDAVVGGRLTPSRNRALAGASRRGRACVQMSDDISRWEYHKGDIRALQDMDANEKLRQANAAVKTMNRIVISPVAAARFLLAKMRAAEGAPRLGGVFPTGNAAFGLLSEAVSRDGFILGDFFVHDRSPCRFDETMTLKEDYDFTCSHLAKHGSVLRCNRLVIHVAHETNSGGAVAIRDSKGEKERQNINILMRKWPGVFRPHGTRGSEQVLMRWSRRAEGLRK